MTNAITLPPQKSKSWHEIFSSPPKGSFVTILLITISAILANLNQLSPLYYPEHDTLTVYQFFSYFYSEIIYNKEIPLWLPYTAYGIPSDSYILFSFGPFQYLSIFLGYIFKIKNTLSLFKMSLIFDSMFLMYGCYLFLKQLIRNQLPIIIATVFIGLIAQYDIQLYWNFKVLLAIPLSLYFAQRWLNTLNPVYFLCSFANLIIWSFGSLPYVLPFQFYIITCYILCFSLLQTKPSNITTSSLLTLYTRAKLQLLDPKNLIFSWIAIIIISVNVAMIFMIKRVMRSEMAYSASAGRTSNFKVPIDSYLNHGGFTDWHKIIEMLTGYPYCDQFLLPFTGVICISFAIIGVLTKKTSKAHLALLLTTLLIIAFSIKQTYVASIIYYLPGMNLFRHIGYVITLAKVMIVMLAGFGINACMDRQKISLVPFFVALLTMLLIMRSSPDFYFLTNFSICLGIIIITILSILFTINPFEKLFRKIISPLVVGLKMGLHSSTDLKTNNHKLFLTGLILLGIFEILSYNHSLSLRTTKNLVLQNLSAYSFHDLVVAKKNVYQPSRQSPKHEAYFVDTGAYYGISGDYLQKDFIPALRQDIISRNVQILLEKRDAQINPFFLRTTPRLFANKILTTGDPRFDHDLANFLGQESVKITLTPNVILAASEIDALNKLATASLSENPIITDVIQQLIPQKIMPRLSNYSKKFSKNFIPLYTITNIYFTANKHKFFVNNFNDFNLWLIYADANNKNWHAYIDGNEENIYPANFAFKAIIIPPGSHEVNFIFSKSTLLYKLFFTLQSLLGLGILYAIFSYPFTKLSIKVYKE